VGLAVNMLVTVVVSRLTPGSRIREIAATA